MNVAIIGTGAYGMALASVFYNNKCKIKMWTNSEEEKNILLKNGKSDKVDFVIPKDIVISTDMKVVVNGAELIMIAIPAPYMAALELLEIPFGRNLLSNILSCSLRYVFIPKILSSSIVSNNFLCSR